MTTAEKQLELLGLSDKESLVFKVLLEGGGLSVADITKALNLKRPTVYLYLEELREKGLVVEEHFKGKKLFKAVSSLSLEKIIKDRISSLKKLSDLIKQLKSIKPSQPISGFEVYYGKKGTLSLADEIARFEGEVYYLGSLEGISDFAGERYYESFYNKTRRKNLGVDYMISDYTKMTVNYFFKESGMFTKRRWLPPDIKIDGCFILFGDKLVIAKYKPDIIATVYEHPGLAAVFKLAYLSLWYSLEGKNMPLDPKLEL